MVRHFEEPGVARVEAAGSWRSLASRLWHFASGEATPAGPVHLNAAFVEPLIASAFELPERDIEVLAPREGEELLPDVESFNVAGQSVLCVVGAGVRANVIEQCVALDWVVLGDATAQGSLAHFDALLRCPDFVTRVRPDLVVRLGGIPASRVLAEQLRLWQARTVSLNGAGLVADPDRLIHEAYAGLPHGDIAPLVANRDYSATWRDASREVARWLETLETGTSSLNEPLVARAVVAASNASGVPLVVGSSMPVRDVEWWAPTRRSATFANRGVNGIDGVVSTILGVSSGSRALGLIGDLTMLHDVSGLVDGLGDAGGSCVLVVVDNHGGGIFSFLPQARAIERGRFEQLFGTPRPHNLEAVALAFGHAATTVATLDELRSALNEGLERDGVSVIVASVPSRQENVDVHESWNDDVAKLIARGGE
jgi:2-succinyl-5-enolpyruvyl-6-hydroxy-3-cyclohexene-1-carboxylate synthase